MVDVTRPAVKQWGSVATPRPVVDFLTTWAVRGPEDKVLDLGAGEGQFLLQAYERLLDLGATRQQALRAIEGVEIDPERYKHAVDVFRQEVGESPPKFRCADFFETRPEVFSADAVIGNPPYVRRSNLQGFKALRSKVLESSPLLPPLRSLSDLYAYFVAYGAQYLKPAGRMALILPASWLDVDYGIELKRILLSQFIIQGIVLFEGPIFEGVLVRPVLLLAEKGICPNGHNVPFIRVGSRLHGGCSLQCLQGDLEGHRGKSVLIGQTSLDPVAPWGAYLRTPESYILLRQSERLVPLGALAVSRIGLQTLAGKFYILDSEEVCRRGIASQYLRPIVLSPKDTPTGVIDEEDDFGTFVLYVDQPLESIRDEPLRNYIGDAQQTRVQIRGKRYSVLGYHNVPRIQQARRRPWYNLKTEIDRRKVRPLLMPRRFYSHFVVVWNRRGIIANENFIEVEPLQAKLLKPLLALLNSAAFELVARSHAQLYGGGVYNLNPADVPQLPVVDLRRLSDPELAELSRLGEEYVSTLSETIKNEIDALVLARALGMDAIDVRRVLDSVAEIRAISLAAKGRGS